MIMTNSISYVIVVGGSIYNCSIMIISLCKPSVTPGHIMHGILKYLPMFNIRRPCAGVFMFLVSGPIMGLPKKKTCK